MNAEQNEKINHSSINDRELEAANNATFDNWTQGMRDLYHGVRDLYKGARKAMEDLDDSNSIMFSDIFGKEEVTKHQHILEKEARREEEAGNLEAANHYKRRNLNYSRCTLGEDAAYTQDLRLNLRSPEEEEREEKLLDSMYKLHAVETFNEILEQKLHHQ